MIWMIPIDGSLVRISWSLYVVHIYCGWTTLVTDLILLFPLFIAIYCIFFIYLPNALIVHIHTTKVVNTYIQYYQPPSIMNTPCAKCGKESSKKCPSCNSVFYCGSQCMKAHRPEHKKVCRKLSKKKNPNNNTRKVGGNVKYKGKELRFNIGDKVSCQVGMDEWQVGSIIQLLYKERGQTFP